MTADVPKSPGLIREVYDELPIEYGQFGINDVPEGDQSWVRLGIPDGRYALATGRALFVCQGDLVVAHVWRRVQDQTPSPLPGWNGVAKTVYESETGNVGLFPLISAPGAAVLELGPPGRYELSVIERPCQCHILPEIDGWMVPRDAVSDFIIVFSSLGKLEAARSG